MKTRALTLSVHAIRGLSCRCIWVISALLQWQRFDSVAEERLECQILSRWIRSWFSLPCHLVDPVSPPRHGKLVTRLQRTDDLRLVIRAFVELHEHAGRSNCIALQRAQSLREAAGVRHPVPDAVRWHKEQ